MAAAGLRDWAAGLADPAQALADLARFEAEAAAFDTLATDLTAAAGFHGSGAQVFLGWLAAQTDRDVDRHPTRTAGPPPGSSSAPGTPPRAANGRSPSSRIWTDDFAERGNSLRAEFADFSDLGSVLDTAGLGFTPDFAATETQEPYLAARAEADAADARRMLYVALTRARDRLILAIPPAPKEPKPTFADLMRNRCGLEIATDGTGLHLCGHPYPARITPAPPTCRRSSPKPRTPPLPPS